MKSLRKQFERFCLRNRNKGIPNLMLYIALGSAVVYFMGLTNGGSVLYELLCFNKTKILQGEVWRLFSFVFTFSLGSSPIFAVIGLFCIYSIGRTIEHLWGTFRFNLFYLGGVILMDVFAMICCPTLPENPAAVTEEAYYMAVYWQYFYSTKMVYFLDMTLLIAYATVYPDAQFMILFIIPVKAWVLGLLYLLLNAIELFNLCYPVFFFPHCLFPLVGFANYLLFFGKDVANLLPLSWRARIRKGRTSQPTRTGTIPFTSARSEQSASARQPYTHRCSVCGRTDVSDPELEFRYCSRCNGYHCYCQDHINDHTHIQ